MNPLTKKSTPVAVGRMNKFPISSQHLTTANFMQFNAAYARPLVPKSHGSLVHKTFVRSEPLDKPCLGSAQIRNSGYWVPFRCVWEPWSDFITDTPHNQPSGTGIIPNCPTILNTTFISFFLQNDLSDVITTGTPDFSTGGQNYVFTPFGRQCMKILHQLGYGIILGDKNGFSHSALPLLCLTKCYMDWYYPQAYAHYGDYATVDGIFQRQITYALTVSELNSIFNVLKCVGYNDDFYSGLWDEATGPNSGVGSTNFVINDITTGTGDYVEQLTGGSTNGTPIWDSTYQSSGIWSQYIDSSVKALTQYVKRHQISAFALDRYLNEFGIMLDADKLKRSTFLGQDTFPYQIGDVMSNADTSPSGGASLGSYAGKGIAYSEGYKYDFNVDEFGYLFVINTIVPDVAYIMGRDPNTITISKLGFFTGEFDGLGPELVTQAELLIDNQDSNYNLNCGTNPFGFAPRYYKEKIPYNRCSGVFRYNSINQDMQGWSTNRLFDASLYYLTPSAFTHNLDFVLGIDADQYDRIFLGANSDDVTDPFYIIHRDDLELYAPMKPLYDDCVFDELDDHQKVTQKIGGVKMN